MHLSKVQKFCVKNLFKRGISASTPALGSNLGKQLIDEGIKPAPDLYRYGISKIKNKNVRKALDVANYIVKETQKRDLNNLFGVL